MIKLIRYLMIGLLVVVAFPLRAAERWALLIGVDKNKALGELKVCTSDAQSMKAVLKRIGYREDHINVLTDDADDMGEWPTIGNIRRGIQSIADVSELGDTILLFYSGHGVIRDEESYLVPVDGDSKNAVPLKWIRRRLAGADASQKILILDACHAGAAKGVDGISSDLKVGRDTILLLSCRRGQVSWPAEETGHSVFTWYLLEGLGGKAAGEDHQVTVEELHRYVRAQVKAWTFRERRPMQTPLVIAQEYATMVLSEFPDDGPGTTNPKEAYEDATDKSPFSRHEHPDSELAVRLLAQNTALRTPRTDFCRWRL